MYIDPRKLFAVQELPQGALPRYGLDPVTPAGSGRRFVAEQLCKQMIYITDLELSVKTRNGLKRLNCKTLQEVAENITEDQFLSTKNIGQSCLRELKAELEKHGLSFLNPHSVLTVETIKCPHCDCGVVKLLITEKPCDRCRGSGWL